jgi:hypothetical protein
VPSFTAVSGSAALALKMVAAKRRGRKGFMTRRIHDPASLAGKGTIPTRTTWGATRVGGVLPVIRQ